MPHRLLCIAILLFWAVAAALLIRRDVLPDLLVGPPPDLRAIVRAGEAPGPVRWTILVADERSSPPSLRSVGEVLTDTKRRNDGWVELTSDARVDSAGLLRGTPWSVESGDRLRILSNFEVDPSGNLFQFRVTIRADRERDDLMTIDGRLRENAIEVRARSPLMPILNWGRTLPYRSRGVVQNTFGPIDRMPGLHIGQRWESQVVNPLAMSGQVEVVRMEVPGHRTILWDKGPVRCLEVVSHFSGMTARTLVRPDGLVLQQEVPTPLGPLYLQRQADRPRDDSDREERR